MIASLSDRNGAAREQVVRKAITTTVRVISVLNAPTPYGRLNREHVKMFNAIVRGKAKFVRRLMFSHIVDHYDEVRKRCFLDCRIKG